MDAHKNIPKNVFRNDRSWYRLSPKAWALLGVLILLNGLNVLFPDLLDAVYRNMDIRLWPGWYFAVLAVALIVSVFWYWGTSRNPTTCDAIEKDTKS